MTILEVSFISLWFVTIWLCINVIDTKCSKIIRNNETILKQLNDIIVLLEEGK